MQGSASISPRKYATGSPGLRSITVSIAVVMCVVSINKANEYEVWSIIIFLSVLEVAQQTPRIWCLLVVSAIVTRVVMYGNSDVGMDIMIDAIKISLCQLGFSGVLLTDQRSVSYVLWYVVDF
jgi:hypothetical protein